MITLSTCGDPKQAAVSYSLIHPEKLNTLSVQIKSLYVDQADYRLQFIHKTQYYLSTWEACLCSLSSDHDGRWRRRKVWGNTIELLISFSESGTKQMQVIVLAINYWTLQIIIYLLQIIT